MTERSYERLWIDEQQATAYANMISRRVLTYFGLPYPNEEREEAWNTVCNVLDDFIEAKERIHARTT